ncbi:MAG: hypothetical protein Q8Q13_02690 [bacterium]|nr:hypothetical protein [bacterium]
MTTEKENRMRTSYQGLAGSLLIEWMDAQRDAERRAKATGTEDVPATETQMEKRLAYYVLRQNRAIVVPELIVLITNKLPAPGSVTGNEVFRMSIGSAIVGMLQDSLRYHNQAGSYAFWKAVEMMHHFGFISEGEVEALAKRGAEGSKNA